MHELIFTSSPAGLNGGRGFCTVAATQGISKTLSKTLEGLSAYDHLHPPGTPAASNNPVNYSHQSFKHGGKNIHVLSATRDAGLDYTQRSNKLSHHVAITKTNGLLAGPAAILSAFPFETEWPSTRPAESRNKPPSIQKHAGNLPEFKGSWKELVGDAGYAGMIAEAIVTGSKRRICIAYSVDQHRSILNLMLEITAVLPPEQRWQATFSTFAQKAVAGRDCKIRCVSNTSPESTRAANNPHVLYINLESPPSLDDASPYVAAAREGRTFEPVRAASPPIKDRRKASVDERENSSSASLIEGSQASAITLVPSQDRNWQTVDTVQIAPPVVPGSGRQQSLVSEEKRAAFREALNAGPPPVRKEKSKAVFILVPIGLLFAIGVVIMLSGLLGGPGTPGEIAGDKQKNPNGGSESAVAPKNETAKQDSLRLKTKKDEATNVATNWLSKVNEIRQMEASSNWESFKNWSETKLEEKIAEEFGPKLDEEESALEKNLPTNIDPGKPYTRDKILEKFTHKKPDEEWRVEIKNELAKLIEQHWDSQLSSISIYETLKAQANFEGRDLLQQEMQSKIDGGLEFLDVRLSLLNEREAYRKEGIESFIKNFMDDRRPELADVGMSPWVYPYRELHENPTSYYSDTHYGEPMYWDNNADKPGDGGIKERFRNWSVGFKYPGNRNSKPVLLTIGDEYGRQTDIREFLTPIFDRLGGENASAHKFYKERILLQINDNFYAPKISPDGNEVSWEGNISSSGDDDFKVAISFVYSEERGSDSKIEAVLTYPQTNSAAYDQPEDLLRRTEMVMVYIPHYKKQELKEWALRYYQVKRGDSVSPEPFNSQKLELKGEAILDQRVTLQGIEVLNEKLKLLKMDQFPGDPQTWKKDIGKVSYRASDDKTGEELGIELIPGFLNLLRWRADDSLYLCAVEDVKLTDEEIELAATILIDLSIEILKNPKIKLPEQDRVRAQKLVDQFITKGLFPRKNAKDEKSVFKNYFDKFDASKRWAEDGELRFSVATKFHNRDKKLILDGSQNLESGGWLKKTYNIYQNKRDQDGKRPNFNSKPWAERVYEIGRSITNRQEEKILGLNEQLKSIDSNIEKFQTENKPEMLEKERMKKAMVVKQLNDAIRGRPELEPSPKELAELRKIFLDKYPYRPPLTDEKKDRYKRVLWKLHFIENKQELKINPQPLAPSEGGSNG